MCCLQVACASLFLEHLIDGNIFLPQSTLVFLQAYSLRDAMNSLSKDKPEAGKVAKAFYRDIEKLTVSSRRKDANTAKQAYESAQSNLSKYLSLL